MRLFELSLRVAAAILAVGTQEAAAQTAPGAPVFFFTKFPTSTAEYRDKLISMFDTNAKWSCGNETGTSKYGLAVPRNYDDNKTMYSIEQYRDDAQFQEHLRAPLVASMFAYIGARPDFWGKAGVDSKNWTVINEMSFVREGYARAADPYLVVEHLTYADTAAVAKALEGWRGKLEGAKKVASTLVFGVYGDPLDKKVLHLLHAYETRAQWMETKQSGPDVTTPSTTYTIPLKKAGGYLYQDPAGKACG